LKDQQAYITAYSSVARRSACRDGNIVFQGDENVDTGDFLTSLYKYLGADYPKFYKMDNLSKLGFLAVELLLSGRNLSEKYSPEETGIVLSNANASLDADVNYMASARNIPSPALFVYTLPNIVIGEISIRHHFKGENAFFVSEKFDEAFMHFYVTDLFSRTALKACICGWVECFRDDYKAVLWLVEQSAREGALPFTIDQIHKSYLLSNGEING
jgi:hypothetical protein